MYSFSYRFNRAVTRERNEKLLMKELEKESEAKAKGKVREREREREREKFYK